MLGSWDSRWAARILSGWSKGKSLQREPTSCLDPEWRSTANMSLEEQLVDARDLDGTGFDVEVDEIGGGRLWWPEEYCSERSGGWVCRGKVHWLMVGK